MAGNSIRVNTDQVAQIASNLESLNKRLSEELTNSKTTIDQLANIWEGEAAQTTISSFDELSMPAISRLRLQTLTSQTHSNNTLINTKVGSCQNSRQLPTLLLILTILSNIFCVEFT